MKPVMISRRIGVGIALALLWAYRNCISPLKPACCRFTPTCSAYSMEAFRQFGVLRGCWLTLWRLLRCHPFYHGSLYDPVPEKHKNRKMTGLGPCRTTECKQNGTEPAHDH